MTAEDRKQGLDPDEQDASSELSRFIDACLHGEAPDMLEFLNSRPDLRQELEPRLLAFRRVEQALARLSPPAKDSPLDSGGSTDIAVGMKVGAFVVERKLAQGGMGAVYIAQQPSLGRRVVLKILPHGLLADEKSIQRFRREAQAVAQLRHPGIIHVLEAGQERSLHYIAMEFVDGLSLDRVIRKLSSASVTDLDKRSFDSVFSGFGQQVGRASQGALRGPYSSVAARIVADVAAALDYAHAKGIVHRDVKPSNIILAPDGTAHLVDFGLAALRDDARVTVSGEVLGTPRYMSPEHLQGIPENVDARSDVYGLGLVLYELLTLRPAFDAGSTGAVLLSVMETEVRKPSDVVSDVPRELEAIVLKAVQKCPADRYQTAAAMEEDLRSFIAGRPVLARGPLGGWSLLRSAIAGRRRIWAVCAVLGLLMALGVWIKFQTSWAGEQWARGQQRKASAALMRAEALVWTIEGRALQEGTSILSSQEAKKVLESSAQPTKDWELEARLRGLLRSRWSPACREPALEFLKTLTADSRQALTETAFRLGLKPEDLVLEWLTYEAALDLDLMAKIWQDRSKYRGAARVRVDSLLDKVPEPPMPAKGVEVLVRNDEKLVVSLFGFNVVEEWLPNRVEAPQGGLVRIWWTSNYAYLRSVANDETPSEEMSETLTADGDTYNVDYRESFDEYMLGGHRQPWATSLSVGMPVAADRGSQ